MVENSAILVIGPRWVGDMVMAQVLLKALKEAEPETPIDVMAPAWAGPLVARMPEVRSLVDAPFPRRKLGLAARWRAGRALRGRYKAAYVLQGSWKSALVPLFAGIPKRVGYRKEMRYGLLTEMRVLPETLKRKTARAFFGLAGAGTFHPPRLTVDPANQARLLAEHGLAAGRFVALVPGAEYGPAKRWPDAKYAALAREMTRRGLAVIALGSANDASVAKAIRSAAPEVIDLTGRTRLEDAVDLLAAAKFAVTNDSGLMHVAAAVGTPLVAVYGSTSPENTPPLGERVETVCLELACSPCHEKTCPLGHFLCLRDLGVAEVLAAIDRLLRVGQEA